jgi:hypothetical protein
MRYLVALALALVLGLTLATSAAAAKPNAVFIDDDNDCASSNRQVSSLPPSPLGDQHFFVWLNTGAAISSADTYQLKLVPLFAGGTTLVGTQPVNFNSCTSSFWAWAEVGYGGFVPGKYRWEVYDPSNILLGSDTVKYE